MPLLEHRWRVVVERVRQRIISAAADRSPRLPDSESAAGLPDHGGGAYASNQLNEATHKVGVLMSMGKPLNPRNGAVAKLGPRQAEHRPLRDASGIPEGAVLHRCG